MIIRKYFLVACASIALPIVWSCGSTVQAQRETAPENGLDSLRTRIESAIENVDAKVGVAMICGKDTLLVNSATSYPLMSVFKFHIAVTLLQKVDAGMMSLDSTLSVPYTQLRPDTYSPMRDDAKGKDLNITVDELMRYSVCRSDNNACDILIDLLGGIDVVNDSMHKLELGDVSLTETEASMHEDILRSYNNTSDPLALCSLIDRLYAGRVLGASSGAYLRRLLGESTTGRGKISAGVPEQSFLGHKSGLSDRKPNGILMASGDVAAFDCGDGKRVSLAILVSDTPETDAGIDSLFSRIASMVHAYYSETK